MTIREGRWLCPSCGAECLGRHENCNGTDGQSGCGSSRPPHVRFYLPENSPIVTDPNQLADAASGLDWNCDHCDGANKNSYQSHRVINCVHCGNGRDEFDPDYKVEATAAPVRPDTAVRTEASRETVRRSTTQRQSPRSRKALAFPFLAVVAVLAAAFTVWFAFFQTKTVEAEVAGFSWARSIPVEEMKTLREEGWSVPTDGRVRDRETRFKENVSVLVGYDERTRTVSDRVQTGTESYSCGTRDLGNGYFQDQTCQRPIYSTVSREETYEVPVYQQQPVYATWYTYNIDRWRTVHNLREGAANKSPKWPANPHRGPKLREGGRSETYTVRLNAGEAGQFDRNLPELRWKALDVGDDVVLHINRAGGVMRIDWPQ